MMKSVPRKLPSSFLLMFMVPITLSAPAILAFGLCSFTCSWSYLHSFFVETSFSSFYLLPVFLLKVIMSGFSQDLKQKLPVDKTQASLCFYTAHQHCSRGLALWAVETKLGFPFTPFPFSPRLCYPGQRLSLTCPSCRLHVEVSVAGNIRHGAMKSLSRSRWLSESPCSTRLA